MCDVWMELTPTVMTNEKKNENVALFTAHNPFLLVVLARNG
jgi:hypothetical protein